MPRSISWRKLIQRFRRLGFDGPHPGGRHLYMRRDSLKVRVPNPHHGDISKALVTKILRQAGIAETEWEQR